MSRPSKLDKERMDLICRSLEVGATYKIAAQVANVHVSTVFGWLAKGKEEKAGKFREFFDRVKRSEGMCAVRDLSIITKASESDWRAAAWRLERRFGYTVAQNAIETPVELSPSELSTKLLIKEIKQTESLVSQLTGPTIDLDEE